MIKKKILSEEDKKIWENYTKSPSDIYDKEKNIINTVRKERFKFDLHGFTLEEANQKVKELIPLCVKKRYNEILLITGKGLHSNSDNDAYVSKDLSKLKFSVPEFIKNDKTLSNHIVSISEASLKDGGAGAILIKFKKL
ncbi:Smr/MutS family protein [bacterium]|nr:Smr/MutS family protein [bacterium]